MHISKNQIEKTIRKYHNDFLQNHFDIFKTMQFLRQHCWFFCMRQQIEIYIKKYFNCQKINIIFTKNTKKFNIRHYQIRHKMKQQ